LLGRVPGSNAFADVTTHPEAQTFPGLIIYRFDSALLFFNADHFKQRIRTIIAEAATKPHHLVIDAETMPLIDTTGAATLAELIEELNDSGIVVAIASAKAAVRSMLERTGLSEQLGAGRIFPTVMDAVEGLVSKQTSNT
jgi:sulfate permease, SulP family